MKNKLLDFIKNRTRKVESFLIRDQLSALRVNRIKSVQKKPYYNRWIDSNLLDFAREFVSDQKILDSFFIKNMNRTFNTKRFNNYVKKRIAECLFDLFNILYDHSFSGIINHHRLILEDNFLNHFALNKYCEKFDVEFDVKWVPPPSPLIRLLHIISQNIAILIKSFKNGMKIISNQKFYKIMIEATVGLYNNAGYYFRDDFFVDGEIIKQQDCIFFSRGVPVEPRRLQAYYDFKNSNYSHVNLLKLKLGIKPFILRIIPKYILSGSWTMIREIRSPMFSLFASLFKDFINHSITYEKFFSNYKVTSEFGHEYYSASHIFEAIICQNYGTKYYLLHWSDNSCATEAFLFLYLGCDKYLIWGNAHVHGIEVDSSMLKPIGFPHKTFINEIRENRMKTLQSMGIMVNSKIISFFPETFGGDCSLSAEQFVVFLETALNTACMEKECTVVVKPKELARHKQLPVILKDKLDKIIEQIKKMPNMLVVDPLKWSFIEVIGISDIVVTQSMTSSATIAIICGIEGLYLDQAGVDHPFSKPYKNKLVFDEPEKLMSMIHEIVIGRAAPLRNIPKEVIRAYDHYDDNCGMDRLRKILVGENH